MVLSLFNINKSTRGGTKSGAPPHPLSWARWGGGHENWSPPTPTLMGEMGGALKVEPPLPPLLGKIVGE